MTVTVVGAGIVGLSIAHELTVRGAAVRIVDMRGVGQGATRASAGILAPHIEGHSDALLRLGVSSFNLYDAFIARVAADAGLPIEYRLNGTLQVARNAAECERLAAWGRPLVGPARARELEPGLGQVEAALFIQEHGYVAVRALMAALQAALLARGITVEDARVDDIEAEAARADAVIVAAGSWTGDLVASGLSRKTPVKPIRGQLLHLRLQRPPASRVIWGERCYIVPWQDGSVLIGATSEDVGFDENPTAAGVRTLLERGSELLPELEAARFEEVRVGLRPATEDELPLIGRSSTMRSLFYATGHYRNGVLLAPWTALAVADLVLDGRERPELAALSPARFGL